MSQIPNNTEPPKAAKNVPHLGLLMSDSSVGAIPPGATVFYIEDPTRVDGVFPWVFVKATRKAWWFQCGCGKSGCTRTMKMTALYRGQHQETKYDLYAGDEE